MKYIHVILLTIPLLAHTYPHPYPDEKSTELDDVDVDNDSDSDHEASDRGDAHVQKRSGGSADYLIHLKTGLLSSLGQASASIASSSSAGSSGGYKSYGHDGHHGNSVEYDPWSLKKSVLNTIFQAVKAITGGVTALKGQLIKGSGYALSASGHVVAASGDKITDVGKIIISSASHKIPLPSGGGQHPFAKLSSLSGASSGGSGGVKQPSGGHVVHTDTITAYEIPSGHTGYEAQKPGTYSSASHNYLPPAGGAGFSHGGHVAFEAPLHNYLPTSYVYDGHDDFNIYGHKIPTDDDKRKGTSQLEEILSVLPIAKTEYTASKTITFSDNPAVSEYEGTGDVHYHTYSEHKHDVGPLESLPHTESITSPYNDLHTQSAADIYHQKYQQKLTPEEIYIAKHPEEGYNYSPSNGNSLTNSDADKNTKANLAVKDLKTILLALEAEKHQQSAKVPTTSNSYNYKKPEPVQSPPLLHKTKYYIYPPRAGNYATHNKVKRSHRYQGGSHKKRHAPPCYLCRQNKRANPRIDTSDIHEYYNQDSLLYSPPLVGGGEIY